GDVLEEQVDNNIDRTEERSTMVDLMFLELMFLEIHLDEAPEGDSFER
ncbi:hypothetical protein Tco_1180025, partial [Tanacetum coccineum]